MITDFGIHADGKIHVVRGMDLLRLLQRCVAARQQGRGVTFGGEGGQKDPYRLRTAQEWFLCARKGFKGPSKYVAVAGRMIEKQANSYYVSDQGPVWRHLSDEPFDRPETGSMTYGGGDPTYPTLAKTANDPASLFKNTDEARSKGLNGVELAEAWNDVTRTRMAIQAMRRMMKGEKLDWNSLKKHYSRIQSVLPVLTVAMFLSEPARNGRAFGINLMLLDMAEAGARYHAIAGIDGFTLNQILWHPDGLDDAAASDVLAFPISAPKSKRDRDMDWVETKGRLHLVGGIMPASPTGGAIKTEPLTGKTEKAYKYDYIHRKEASVLIYWLKRRIGNLSLVGSHNTDPRLEAAPYDSIVFPDRGKMDPVKAVMRQVKTLIERRLDTLDAM